MYCVFWCGHSYFQEKSRISHQGQRITFWLSPIFVSKPSFKHPLLSFSSFINFGSFCPLLCRCMLVKIDHMQNVETLLLPLTVRGQSRSNLTSLKSQCLSLKWDGLTRPLLWFFLQCYSLRNVMFGCKFFTRVECIFLSVLADPLCFPSEQKLRSLEELVLM